MAPRTQLPDSCGSFVSFTRQSLSAPARLAREASLGQDCRAEAHASPTQEGTRMRVGNEVMPALHKLEGEAVK